jgi:hypothetical protein
MVTMLRTPQLYATYTGSYDVKTVRLSPRLEQVLEKALALGCSDVEAVRYLLTAETLERRLPEPVDVQSLSCYERPLPTLVEYDQLLTMASATEVLQ